MSRGVSRTRTHSGAGNAPRVDDYEAAADAVSGQVCGPGVLAAGSLFGFMFGAVGMAAENAVNGTNGSQVLRQSGWAVGLAIGASLGVHSTATAHWRHASVSAHLQVLLATFGAALLVAVCVGRYVPDDIEFADGFCSILVASGAMIGNNVGNLTARKPGRGAERSTSFPDEDPHIV